MKHQHKALASLIAGLLGTTLAHNALAVTTIDLSAAKADLYASEMSSPEIKISSAYVTKLNGSDPGLSDTDVAVFAGKTSYVRIDFDNATITTDATVQLGGVGTGGFVASDVSGTPPTPNYGTHGIGMTSSDYVAGGGLYKSTFGGHNFITYGTGLADTDSNCPTATTSLGLVGTDGIKLSATAAGTGTAIFALTESGTAATPTAAGTGGATGSETTHVLAGCKVGFYISKLKVIDTAKPVTMSYSLHTNNVSASYPLGDPKSTPAAKKTGIQVINFAPALSYTLTARDATSEVAALFKEFKAGENGSTKTAGVVGLLDIKTTDGIKNVEGNTISSVSTILGSGSKLDITGDFSTIAANKGRVYVTKGVSCATTSADLISNIVELPSSATAGDYTASLTMDYIGTSANVTGSPGVGRICLDITNTTGTVSTSGTEIAATDNAFLVKFTPMPETNYKSFTPKEGTAGKIIRNGAELEAPYITASAAFTTRILLSNFSDAKMPFTVRLATDGVGGSTAATAVLPKVTALTAPPSGSTLPVYGVTDKSYQAAGEVSAKSMLVINATSQLATVTGGGRYSATFTFQGGNENVQGVVQTINKTTGEVTSIPMVRKGGGNGN